MKELFPGFYRPTEEEFTSLWKDGLFVLDANFLLNIYRFPEKASNELLDIMSKISDRLWIPYEAALEFQRNRLSVIADQKKKFSDVRILFDDTKKQFKVGLSKLQLKKDTR